MKKLAVMAWLGAIAIAAIALFHVKNEVKQLEKALAAEHQALLQAQESIHVLKAEWSFLNQPGRIAELARRHLALEPIEAERVVQVEELPYRLYQEEFADDDAPGSGAPGAVEPDAPSLAATLASAKAQP